MSEPSAITFDDGAAYERFMGGWSRLAGERFLDRLAPQAGGRWCDVGCGNGAFSELLLERAGAAQVDGIDPSEAQIAYARQRLAARPARFIVGDAAALPYADGDFDAAVMALVIFFVPEPARGVAEMRRVVRPGGSVAAYAWDILGGGFPYAVLQEEMAAAGLTPIYPPSVEAARLETLRALWQGAGLVDVETFEFAVERSHDDFASFWRIACTGPRIASRLASLAKGVAEQLQERLRARLERGSDGRVSCVGRANAVRGRVPG